MWAETLRTLRGARKVWVGRLVRDTSTLFRYTFQPLVGSNNGTTVAGTDTAAIKNVLDREIAVTKGKRRERERERGKESVCVQKVSRVNMDFSFIPRGLRDQEGRKIKYNNFIKFKKKKRLKKKISVD